jgi:hypothetical protein
MTEETSKPDFDKALKELQKEKAMWKEKIKSFIFSYTASFRCLHNRYNNVPIEAIKRVLGNDTGHSLR